MDLMSRTLPHSGELLPRAWMLAVAGLAFAVRAAVAVQLDGTALFQRPQLDSSEFLIWADGIARGNFFQWLAPTHGPGYPFFLGALLFLTRGSLLAVRLAQAAFGAVACVAAAALAARVFDRRAGLAAGLLLALYGPLVYTEVSLLAEGLFVLLLTLALLVLTRAEASPGVAAAAGALLGLAAVTRATALPLLPLFAALLLLPPRLRPGWKGWPRTTAVWMATAWVAVVAPVLVFLRVSRGSWLPVQAFGGLNFYMGNHAGSGGTPWARLGGAWDLVHYEPQRSGVIGDAERERYFLKKAWQEIGEHPSAFLAGLAGKALWLVQDDEIRESHSLYFFREHSRVLRVLPGFGLLFPMALWGLWLAASRRSLPLPVAAYLLVMTASCVVLIVSSRYRLPLVPALAVFAGGAAVQLLNRLRERRFRELAPAAAVVVAAVLVSQVRDHAHSRNTAEEWALSASSLQMLGRNEEAKAAVRRALEEDPRSALAWVQEGRIHFAEGDLDRAGGAFERAVEISPDYQLARLMLGQARRRKGDEEGALRELRRSLWLVPDDPGTLAELGSLLLSRGQAKEAADHLRRLVAIDPANTGATLALARAEVAAGRPREGVETASRAARRAPADPEAWLVLARLATEAGDVPRAREALSRARAILGPLHPAVDLGWARLESRQGEHEAADRRLRELLLRNPGIEAAEKLFLENAAGLGRRAEAEVFLASLPGAPHA
jgi:tetratricopeptide (TPR) repeat protein